ncbi:MAG: TRAP transporter permease [Candidatus Rokuibacteriota bacterium]
MTSRPLLVSALAVSWSLFHLATGFLGARPAFQQRAIHLAFGLVLVFLTVPLRGGALPRGARRVIDVALALLAAVATGYVAWDYESILLRSGTFYAYEMWLGALLVLAILEGTRRTLGWPLPLLAVLSIAYAVFGGDLPGLIAHRGYSARRIISTLYLTFDGIFGLILGVSATFVFLFVLFGIFFRESGAGQFFLDIAQSLFGGVRGGAAKVSIVGSSLFGMISGSTVANVGTVGTVTIPLMKRSGFTPSFAAAVESAASVAGQLMPPVMGAAAFIMAEVLGVPYIHVAMAAAIPAALYYFALFVMVDLQSAKLGLRGLPREERPSLAAVVRKGWTALIPVSVLIYLMAVVGYSPGLASFWATMSVVAIGLLRRTLSPAGMVRVLADGALAALEVVMAVACVGVIIGMVVLTGIGLKLSTLLLDISGGNLLVLLLLTMVASLVLGTALPTTATYVLLAVLVAPAIVAFGVPPMAAHLFVFYFGVIADITPPTALCVFVACNIAGAPFQRTCWLACRLALAGFILPFFFVFGPGLVLIGGWSTIAFAAVTATLGVVALAVAIEGYLFRPLPMVDRVVTAAGALLLIYPGWGTDVLGAAAVAIIAARQLAARRRFAREAATLAERAIAR